MMPWGVDHCTYPVLKDDIGSEVTYDAVRRWSLTVGRSVPLQPGQWSNLWCREALITTTDSSVSCDNYCEVTYDAVRRWSRHKPVDVISAGLGEVTYDAVRRWSQMYLSRLIIFYFREVTYDAVRRWSQGLTEPYVVLVGGEVTYDAVRRWSHYSQNHSWRESSMWSNLWCREALITGNS